MDQQLPSNNQDKSTSSSNSSSQRSSLQIIDRCNSTTSSSRTLSPIAFFHDGIIMNDVEVHNDFMGGQRRARAIATAPRRKRHDDDDKEEEEVDDDEHEKTLLGFIKTSAVPIHIPVENQQRHSLPRTQSGIDLLPTFCVDPPSQDIHNHHSRHRNSSVHLSSRNKPSKK